MIRTNHTNGAALKLDLAQLKNESDSWKRSLGFMTDENIHLKSRLTYLLKKESTDGLLEKAEKFHADFIKQDERIGLLRNDISELDSLLLKDNNGKEENTNEIKTRLAKLRNNMRNAAKQFDQLKISFNDYLATYI
jgi:hypothetical protein